jgi:hypothetical protein
MRRPVPLRREPTRTSQSVYPDAGGACQPRGVSARVGWNTRAAGAAGRRRPPRGHSLLVRHRMVSSVRDEEPVALRIRVT